MRALSPSRPAVAVVALALMVTTSLALAADETVIVLQKQARSNGLIQIILAPEGGEPQTIEVTVLEKMKLKEIAGDIMKEVVLALGDGYKVEINDDHRVVIEPRKDTPALKASIGSQTVEGLSVSIK